jgi:hypothetical protein
MLQKMFKDVYGEDVAEPLAAAKELFAYVASGVGAGADRLGTCPCHNPGAALLRRRGREGQDGRREGRQHV